MRRLLDRLLRRLVRWLRRRRYARTAGRIRALEIELGMISPDDTARERLSLLADHAATVYAGVGAYWTGEAQSTTQYATSHGRNHFANGGMTILEDQHQLTEALATPESAERLIDDYAAYHHDAAKCPTRLETTGFSDPAPTYIHGAGCLSRLVELDIPDAHR